MEKNPKKFGSKTFLSANLRLKVFTPSPSSKVLKLPLPTLKASKSTNESPINVKPERKKLPKLTKLQTVAYTEWEMFNANREPRSNLSKHDVHKLRRDVKNPHIYVNSINIDHDQKLYESHLFKAFRNIHKD